MTTPAMVGLDIGATKMLGVAAAADGRVLAQVQVPTPTGAHEVVDAAAAVVAELRQRTGDALDGSVGVGVPGIVDRARGALKHAVNLGVDGDWFPLRDQLADRLGATVVIDNDVNAAAFGVARLAGLSDVGYVSLGTGLASAVVLDGRLLRGAHNAAGEIGHIPVDPAGRTCPCGQVGCLETVASGAALAEAWPGAQGPPAQALFDAADQGDPRAISLRDTFAARVADAVRIVALTSDPEVVVLGGGVSQVGARLRDAVAAALRDQARTSSFLQALGVADRLQLVRHDVPVAALGAALLGGVEGG